MSAVYPEYLADLNVLICPSSSNNSGDLDTTLGIIRDDGSGTCQYDSYVTDGGVNYFYFGYVLDKVGPNDPVGDYDGGILNLQMVDLTWEAFEEEANIWDLDPTNDRLDHRAGCHQSDDVRQRNADPDEQRRRKQRVPKPNCALCHCSQTDDDSGYNYVQYFHVHNVPN